MLHAFWSNSKLYPPQMGSFSGTHSNTADRTCCFACLANVMGALPCLALQRPLGRRQIHDCGKVSASRWPRTLSHILSHIKSVNVPTPLIPPNGRVYALRNIEGWCSTNISCLPQCKQHILRPVRSPSILRLFCRPDGPPWPHNTGSPCTAKYPGRSCGPRGLPCPSGRCSQSRQKAPHLCIRQCQKPCRSCHPDSLAPQAQPVFARSASTPLPAFSPTPQPNHPFCSPQTMGGRSCTLDRRGPDC
jgi:hypothetical protein